MFRKLFLRSVQTLELWGRRTDRFSRLLGMELKNRTDKPLAQRLSALRHGFLSESLLLYDLSPERRNLYLSDYERTVRTPDLNGEYRILVKDKLLFDVVTRPFPDLHIPTYGVIDHGRLLNAPDSSERDPLLYLNALLDEQETVVLKPVVGGGGAQIRFLRRADKDYTINEESVSETQLKDILASLRRNMVSEFVRQCPEFEALYPRTVNTIRLLTMWDEDAGEPFIAFALLRVGSDASFPVDNWTQGGIGAAIDIASGRAGKGASYLRHKGQLTWHASHPDSGAQIEGFVIPHWDGVVDGVLRLARSLPVLTYVGWDVIVSADGPKLLEGNHFPDVNLLQVHRPLLAEPRIARFYRARGITGR